MYVFITEKGNGPLLEYIYPNNYYGFHIGLYPGTYWLFAATDNYYMHHTEPMFNKTNHWYFAGVSYNHSSQKFTNWKDGEKFSDFHTNPGTWRTDGFIRLGARKVYHVTRYDGCIACLMIYAHALLDSEVKEAMQECLTVLSRKYTLFGFIWHAQIIAFL